MKGFKQYKGLTNVKRIMPEFKISPVSDVKSEADKVFDLIFAKDENGWPNCSVEVMLSPKTSDEVRTFIQQNLMQVRDDAHLVNDPAIVAEFNKLESDFIAKCSRNRFESIEHYEERLNSIIKDDETASLIKRFHDSLKKSSSAE